MTIGEIISTRRKALGMTLDEIAKKVGHPLRGGVS